jgi:serine protease AprX
LGYGIPNFTAAYNFTHPNAPLGTTAGGTPLRVYPNPTHTGEFTLSLPPSLRAQALRVRILDSKGAVVLERSLAATPITLADVPLRPAQRLAPGAYQCVVQPLAGGKAQSVRFVQQ